jgi:hypothetical protein
MQRRKFSREFKIEAVRLVRERGVSVATHLLQIHAVGAANRRRTSTGSCRRTSNGWCSSNLKGLTKPIHRGLNS